MFHHNPVLENAFVLYVLALLVGMPLGVFAPDYAIFLALSLALLSFGYLLNDAVDRDRDAAFRFDNPFRDHTPRQALAVVAVAFLCQVPPVLAFRLRPGFVPLWLAWLATAVLYSLPSVYLKGRGWVGLVDVTLALRTLPAAMAMAVFPVPAEPGLALMLCYVTLRGMGADLAHQVLHLPEDGANQVGTLAVQLGSERATALLEVVLRAERLLLLAVAAWLPLRFGGQASALGAAALWAHLACVLALTVYAEAYVFGGLSPNPHRAGCHKDVFYLLHKSHPKLVLPALVVIVLSAANPWWLLVLLPQLVLYRAFSVRRILGGLRIRPTP